MSRNTEAIEGAYEAFARDDAGAVIAMVDGDAEWAVTESLPHGGTFHGPDDVAKFFQGIAEKWSNLHLDIDQILDGRTHVVGIGRAHGKLKDGRDAGYGFAHVFEMSDGRITGFQEFAAPDETLRSGA
jgi:uncharacterized protein